MGIFLASISSKSISLRLYPVNAACLAITLPKVPNPTMAIVVILGIQAFLGEGFLRLFSMLSLWG